MSASAIIDGVASGAEDDAVVRLVPTVATPGGHFCSGVLLAPNVLLTARHCTSRVDSSAPMVCAPDGTTVENGKVAQDYDPTKLGVVMGGSTILAKGRKAFRPKQTTLCNSDISLLVLDSEVPNVSLMPIRLDTPVKKGEAVIAVGWGVSNNSDGVTRRRRSGVPILAIGPHPDIPEKTLGPNEFGVGEATCQGDSGGPAFDAKTGAVLGVVSRGGNQREVTNPPWAQCVDGNGTAAFNLYTRTSAFKELILEAFAEAGVTPWIEGQPDPRKAPAGEACTSDDGCLTGVCLSTQTCAEPCEEAGLGCAEGTTCRAVDGTNKCETVAPTSNPAAPRGDEKSGCSASSASPPGGTLACCFALALGVALLARGARRRGPARPR